MKNYTQLSQEERYQIFGFQELGYSLRAIAQRLGRHVSTISRERARNSSLDGYVPEKAHRLATVRASTKQPKRIDEACWLLVAERLKENWSPEQISGRFRQEHGWTISPQRIYQFVAENKEAGGDLHCNLRHQKQRRKRYGSEDNRGQIKDRVSIDERPGVVDERSRIGDWEADTVIGEPGGKVLVTVVERKSKLTVARLVDNKRADSVRHALIQTLSVHRDQVHTVTFDNGKEFAEHHVVGKALNADTYFAHPYHSWERGVNENTNGLIRQYLPKGSSFNNVTTKEIETMVNQLNNRPRKTLGWKTPNEVYFRNNQIVALAS